MQSISYNPIAIEFICDNYKICLKVSTDDASFYLCQRGRNFRRRCILQALKQHKIATFYY